MADSWCWLRKVEQRNIVSSSYTLITDCGGQQQSFPYKLLWDKSIPLKVGAFRWRTILDRIPTFTNTSRRSILTTNDSQMCCFCNSEAETSEHMFLSCNFSYSVWMHIYCWLGIETVLSGNLLELLQQHDGHFVGRKLKRAWRMFWFAIIRSLWLLRNDIIFSQGTKDFDKIIDLIKIRVWSWCHARLKQGGFSFLDWSINPQACLLYDP